MQCEEKKKKTGKTRDEEEESLGTNCAKCGGFKGLLPKHTTGPLKGQSILAVGLCICFHLLDGEASSMITEQGLDQ